MAMSGVDVCRLQKVVNDAIDGKTFNTCTIEVCGSTSLLKATIQSSYQISQNCEYLMSEIYIPDHGEFVLYWYKHYGKEPAVELDIKLVFDEKLQQHTYGHDLILPKTGWKTYECRQTSHRKKDHFCWIPRVNNNNWLQLFLAIVPMKTNTIHSSTIIRDNVHETENKDEYYVYDHYDDSKICTRQLVTINREKLTNLIHVINTIIRSIDHSIELKKERMSYKERITHALRKPTNVKIFGVGSLMAIGTVAVCLLRKCYV